LIIWIYELYLNDPGDAPMDPVFANFRPLTASQRKIGKYFLVVAGVFLLQILVGSIVAHYYSERTDFYGIKIDSFLPFNFLREPVDFGTVWFLFRAATPPGRAIQACDGVYLSAGRELLLQLLGRSKPMDSLRIFLGHAGWATGQLEAEIERHDWTSKRAEMEAIFSGKSEYPWPAPQYPKPSI
jgi:Uncharacterized ACR, COG1678